MTSNQKVSKKKLFLELIRNAYRFNNWKLNACLLRNHQSQKRVHLGKQLECQLANKNDLQSKSVMKEIVFKLVFSIRIDYSLNNFKHIAFLLLKDKFQKRSIYRS